MIKCKNGACPNGKDVCCYYCEQCPTCTDACDFDDHPYSCPDGELSVVTSEDETSLAMNLLTDLVLKQKTIEEQSKKLKEQLLAAMGKYGVKKIENEHVIITYVAPTTRTSMDTTKLKKERPDIVEAYSKVSNVASSVRVTVK